MERLPLTASQRSARQSAAARATMAITPTIEMRNPFTGPLLRLALPSNRSPPPQESMSAAWLASGCVYLKCDISLTPTRRSHAEEHIIGLDLGKFKSLA